MRQLEPPSCCASELFDLCTQEIPSADVRERLIAEKHLIEGEYVKYTNHTSTQTWNKLVRASYGNEDQIVIGGLTKRELTNLYTKGMVASKGPARTIYDEIKLIARDECPYCGGCGELIEEEGIGTLDHFLPKAYFPVYSILPANLVPACAVCNAGMGSGFPTSPNEQPLHPYFDAPHFFNEKWTTASVIEDIPVAVTFGVSPPDHWSEKDKSRILSHFYNCKLAGRYRSKVVPDVTSLIDQRKTVHRNLDAEGFRQILMVVANNPRLPINGWKRTLFQGLAASDWFCEYNF